MNETEKFADSSAAEDIPPELLERLRQVEDETAGEDRLTAAFLGKYITCGTFFTAVLVFPAVLFFLLIPEDPISPLAAGITVLLTGVAGGLLTGVAAALRPRKEL